MQNATRPGVAAPMPAPPQVPMMPTGYSAPQYPQYQPQQPVVVLQSAAKNIANKPNTGNIFSKIFNNPLFSTFVIIWVTIFILYLFLNSDAGKDFMENFPKVADGIFKIAEVLGIGAVAWGVWSVAPGLLSKARKAGLLAEDAKAAREAGNLEKAEKLEKEAADAKAEAEAAGEEVEGATQEAREAEAAAQEAREAGAAAREAREAEATAQEVREAASLFRI